MRHLPKIKRRKTLGEKYNRPVRTAISKFLMYITIGAIGGAVFSLLALILFCLTESAQSYNPQDFILFVIGGAIGGMTYPLFKTLI